MRASPYASKNSTGFARVKSKYTNVIMLLAAIVITIAFRNFKLVAN